MSDCGALNLALKCSTTIDSSYACLDGTGPLRVCDVEASEVAVKLIIVAFALVGFAFGLYQYWQTHRIEMHQVGFACRVSQLPLAILLSFSGHQTLALALDRSGSGS